MKKEDKFEDADRINMDQDHEVWYWTSQLKVTSNEA
jgi:hypothetical protein